MPIKSNTSLKQVLLPCLTPCLLFVSGFSPTFIFFIGIKVGREMSTCLYMKNSRFMKTE
ncbi:hypothetical protein BVRB_8g192190 [Beta vulgaris subsp. vulgaris]|nr:hypothetical protein BVRB_8g192190 [Beta vulgaris subsp. vulgaris]